MSDLQDCIANTSVKAFNSGYLQGAWDERQRIVELIEQVANNHNTSEDEKLLAASHTSYQLIALIKGEQK